MTAMRLAKLVEVQKYDLALRLSKSFLTTYHNSAPMELDYNQDELDFITDVHFCTLYRRNMQKDLIREVSTRE